MSEPAKTVHEALTEVMRDVTYVGKDGKHIQGNQVKFNFRGIDGVMNAVGPALRNYGVKAVPDVQDIQYGVVATRGGTQMTTCRLKMLVRWYGPAGDFIESTTWGEAFDSGDKATAKAHSVAFRTAILQTLCLPTDEPDPDEAAYERETEKQRVAREADLKAWGDKLLAFEQQGDRAKVQAGMEWAGKNGDQQKFQMAKGIFDRMPVPAEVVAEVLDGEVIANGSNTA